MSTSSRIRFFYQEFSKGVAGLISQWVKLSRYPIARMIWSIGMQIFFFSFFLYLSWLWLLLDFVHDRKKLKSRSSQKRKMRRSKKKSQKRRKKKQSHSLPLPLSCLWTCTVPDVQRRLRDVSSSTKVSCFLISHIQTIIIKWLPTIIIMLLISTVIKIMMIIFNDAINYHGLLTIDIHFINNLFYIFFNHDFDRYYRPLFYCSMHAN